MVTNVCTDQTPSPKYTYPGRCSEILLLKVFRNQTKELSNYICWKLGELQESKYYFLTINSWIFKIRNWYWLKKLSSDSVRWWTRSITTRLSWNANGTKTSLQFRRNLFISFTRIRTQLSYRQICIWSVSLVNISNFNNDWVRNKAYPYWNWCNEISKIKKSLRNKNYDSFLAFRIVSLVIASKISLNTSSFILGQKWKRIWFRWRRKWIDIWRLYDCSQSIWWSVFRPNRFLCTFMEK